MKLSPLHFTEKVFAVVRTIPKGSVFTYKEVATRAGRPGAYRAVGNILHTNYNLEIPCHRVVRSDGKLGGYNRGTAAKIKKLKEENISSISSYATANGS